MTLRHLKIFVAVCEADSVTKAAQNLHLAQPSVSLAITELEEYYGIRLFDRISRRLLITELGKQFLDYATHIVTLFDRMETEIRNWDTAGVLRIGSSITIGNHLIPGYVKTFQESHPQMKVQVTIDNSRNIEDRILTNDVDFALIEGIVHNDQIASQKFMEDELVLVAGKTHPLYTEDEVGIHDLMGYDFILREKGSGGRDLFDSTMVVHQIEIDPLWESVSNQAIIRAVAAGLGISVLPLKLLENELSEGSLKRIEIRDVSFRRDYFVIHHRNKYLTESAKRFIEICCRP